MEMQIAEDRHGNLYGYGLKKINAAVDDAAHAKSVSFRVNGCMR